MTPTTIHTLDARGLWPLLRWLLVLLALALALAPGRVGGAANSVPPDYSLLALTGQGDGGLIAWVADTPATPPPSEPPPGVPPTVPGPGEDCA